MSRNQTYYKKHKAKIDEKNKSRYHFNFFMGNKPKRNTGVPVLNQEEKNELKRIIGLTLHRTFK